MKWVQCVPAVLWLMVGVSGFVGAVQAEEQVAVAAKAPMVNVAATSDIEATMKKMGYTFKQAMLAEDVPAMTLQVSALSDLVASVQAYQFTPEKQQVFQQGLSKVAAQLTLVQAELAKNDLAGAKQALTQVDSLKKQYHKERAPSFWQLIFGG